MVLTNRFRNKHGRTSAYHLSTIVGQNNKMFFTYKRTTWTIKNHPNCPLVVQKLKLEALTIAIFPKNLCIFRKSFKIFRYTGKREQQNITILNMAQNIAVLLAQLKKIHPVYWSSNWQCLPFIYFILNYDIITYGNRTLPLTRPILNNT